MREEQAVRGALLELMLSSVYAAKGCANSSAQGIKHCTHMQGSGLCDRWVYTWELLSFMQAPGTGRLGTRSCAVLVLIWSGNGGVPLGSHQQQGHCSCYSGNSSCGLPPLAFRRGMMLSVPPVTQCGGLVICSLLIKSVILEPDTKFCIFSPSLNPSFYL